MDLTIEWDGGSLVYEVCCDDPSQVLPGLLAYLEEETGLQGEHCVLEHKGTRVSTTDDVQGLCCGDVLQYVRDPASHAAAQLQARGIVISRFTPFLYARDPEVLRWLADTDYIFHNLRMERGNALLEAVRHNAATSVAILLSCGMDPNAVVPLHGRHISVISHAITYAGHEVITDLLAAGGVLISVGSEREAAAVMRPGVLTRSSVVQRAAVRGVEVLRVVLQALPRTSRSFMVNWTPSGSTPLFLAANRGEVEAAALLIEEGACLTDPQLCKVGNPAGARCVFPLMAAAVRTAERAAERGAVAAPAGLLQELLHRAVCLGGWSMLVAVETAVGASLACTVTVLETVVALGKLDMVTTVLQRRGSSAAPPQSAHDSAWVRMIPADIAKHAITIVRPDTEALLYLLFAHGADPHCRSLRPQLPLIHTASSLGHSRIVDVLLSHGVAVNSFDAHGTTSLVHAARSRSVETVSVLLEAGANVLLGYGHGFTQHPLVVGCTSRAVVQALWPHFFPHDSLLSMNAFMTFATGPIRAMRAAFELGVDLADTPQRHCTRTVQGIRRTFLWGWHDRASLREAVAAGALRRPRENPLRYWVSTSHVSVVKELLAAGASVTRTSSVSMAPRRRFWRRESPFEYAANNSPDMLAVLLEACTGFALPEDKESCIACEPLGEDVVEMPNEGDENELDTELRAAMRLDAPVCKPFGCICSSQWAAAQRREEVLPMKPRGRVASVVAKEHRKGSDSTTPPHTTCTLCHDGFRIGNEALINDIRKWAAQREEAVARAAAKENPDDVVPATAPNEESATEATLICLAAAVATTAATAAPSCKQETDTPKPRPCRHCQSLASRRTVQRKYLRTQACAPFLGFTPKRLQREAARAKRQRPPIIQANIKGRYVSARQGETVQCDCITPSVDTNTADQRLNKWQRARAERIAEDEEEETEQNNETNDSEEPPAPFMLRHRWRSQMFFCDTAALCALAGWEVSPHVSPFCLLLEHDVESAFSLLSQFDQVARGTYRRQELNNAEVAASPRLVSYLSVRCGVRGWSPVHTAAASERVPATALERLLQCSAESTAHTASGDNVLHLCSSSEKLRVLAAHIPPYIWVGLCCERNHAGETPQEAAQREGRTVCAELLAEGVNLHYAHYDESPPQSPRSA